MLRPAAIAAVTLALRLAGCVVDVRDFRKRRNISVRAHQKLPRPDRLASWWRIPVAALTQGTRWLPQWWESRSEKPLLLSMQKRQPMSREEANSQQKKPLNRAAFPISMETAGIEPASAVA